MFVLQFILKNQVNTCDFATAACNITQNYFSIQYLLVEIVRNFNLISATFSNIKFSKNIFDKTLQVEFFLCILFALVIITM